VVPAILYIEIPPRECRVAKQRGVIVRLAAMSHGDETSIVASLPARRRVETVARLVLCHRRIDYVRSQAQNPALQIRDVGKPAAATGIDALRWHTPSGRCTTVSRPLPDRPIAVGRSRPTEEGSRPRYCDLVLSAAPRTSTPQQSSIRAQIS